MQTRISNRGKQKTSITRLFYVGCEIRALLLPDSRDKDMRIELLLVRSRMWNAGSESQYGDELI